MQSRVNVSPVEAWIQRFQIRDDLLISIGDLAKMAILNVGLAAISEPQTFSVECFFAFSACVCEAIPSSQRKKRCKANVQCGHMSRR